MKTFVVLTAAVAAVSLVTAKADILGDWSFETSLPTTAGPFSPEIGSGSASGSHVSAATYSNPAGNGSSHSFSANTWAVGDFWEFDVSTISYTGIQISFDQASSNTGPGTFGLFYSVNGGSYTQIGANYTVLANASPNPVWNATTSSSIYTFTPDLSSTGTALNNATSVSFRLFDESAVSANGGTVGTGGTDRVDNFVVSASPVPEPSSLALGLIGGFAWLVALRRKR
ncbi:MAG: PEP-CTERM sorting domain-containing protein [Verrucomicrobiota bacterium]